jgi:hypothetical protein
VEPNRYFCTPANILCFVYIYSTIAREFQLIIANIFIFGNCFHATWVIEVLGAFFAFF